MERAPACGVPGYCSRRSGTAAPCAAAASPPPAPASCSSAARAPTSPPSALAAPAPARERRAAAKAPRMPCGRERGIRGRPRAAHADTGARRPSGHGSARAARGGLTPGLPRRAPAMAPRSRRTGLRAGGTKPSPPGPRGRKPGHPPGDRLGGAGESEDQAEAL